MALKSGRQGHQPQHGMERAYHEVMQGDSGGVKKWIGSATPWPPDMAVLEEMHGKIVLKGSCDQLEEISSTTTQPLDVAVHEEAYGGASSKASARHKEHIGVTTPQGGGVAAEHTGGSHHWRQSNAI
ncbi:hypothetical protein CJ030_MR7G011805 [Morella rubra]|uniref:Uncharacterized protein n=1 Tax=Morella rubra TaxID=262757 RepID=A0A6A1V0X1_9ROSI|nr:hypothetical protein CJ030_MR7G011805 [Morella rubra]